MQRSEYDERSERGARGFRKLMVDPKKTMGLKIFRLDERSTVLVIDEDIKRGIEVAQLKGFRADRIELSRQEGIKSSCFSNNDLQSLT